jgi:hypothetical protein
VDCKSILRSCKPSNMRVSYLLICLSVLSACSEQPKRDEWAVVVSITPHPNRMRHGDELIVTARGQDELMGTKTVLTAGLTCRVGDTIRATSQGLALTLAKGACER